MIERRVSASAENATIPPHSLALKAVLSPFKGRGGQPLGCPTRVVHLGTQHTGLRLQCLLQHRNPLFNLLVPPGLAQVRTPFGGRARALPKSHRLGAGTRVFLGVSSRSRRATQGPREQIPTRHARKTRAGPQTLVLFSQSPLLHEGSSRWRRGSLPALCRDQRCPCR